MDHLTQMLRVYAELQAALESAQAIAESLDAPLKLPLIQQAIASGLASSHDMHRVLQAQSNSEPTDAAGVPTSCGCPLCEAGHHHEMCKLFQPNPPKRHSRNICLVATGQAFEGRETYHRYEQGVPLGVEFEMLHTVPWPTPEMVPRAAWNDTVKRMGQWREAAERSRQARPLPAGEPAGWRPRRETPGQPNLEVFQAGKPTQGEIAYWASQCFEIEYCYTQQPVLAPSEEGAPHDPL